MNRAAVVPLTETMIREIARVDGVESVAGTSITIATGNTTNTNVLVPGRTEPLLLGNYSVHPDLFATMRIRLLAGRTLSRRYANDLLYAPVGRRGGGRAGDAGAGPARPQHRRQPPRRRADGLSRSPRAVGKQLRLDVFPEEVGMLPATIVGVVENSRFRSLRESVEPTMFFDRGVYRNLAIRYRSSNPEAVRQNVERVWRRLVPDVPFEGQFADDQLAELYATDAARGQTFAGFSALAVMIACLGLFGLAAFTAERRTREIGIRKVFGARSRDIVRLLAWQFSKPVILANLIAWPVAWWVMRDWLNTFRRAHRPRPDALPRRRPDRAGDRDRHRLRPRSCASRVPTRSRRFAMNRI